MIKLHLQSTNKCLDKIYMDVIEVMKSLQFTQSILHKELGTIKIDIKKLASDTKELENDLLDPTEVSEKLIELEDRSRKNNLLINSLTENANKTWDGCVKKVQEALRDKLNIQDDIELNDVSVWESKEELVHGQLSADLSVLKTNRRYCEIPRN